MTTAVVFAAIAAATAIASGTKSALSQAKARKTQNRIAGLDARRKRLAVLRETRQKLGQRLNAAATGGTDQSSSSITGRSGLLSQASTELSFLDKTENLSREVARLSGSAAFFGSVSGVAQQGVSFALDKDKVAGLKGLFN